MSQEKVKSPSSDRVLQRLLDLHPKVIDLSLVRIERLLAALHHPEKKLPPTLHVAGTNGKGSTIAFLRAILEAAGKSTHVYTSPHLVHFHERIRLGQKLITEKRLESVLSACEKANGNQAITFFEITTAAAFLAFAQEKADYLLLETGLGGRLDATNVIDQPRLSILTPISMDHMQYLGTTLCDIAREKAGIIKPAIPVIVAPQPPEALTVITEIAAQKGAPLVLFGRDWTLKSTKDGFTLALWEKTYHFPQPVLVGQHQIINAATAAVAAIAMKDAAITDDALSRGVQSASWPARLQKIDQGHLRDLLPDSWEVWLDGGHNAAAGAMLKEVASRWQDRPLHLLFSMLDTKEATAFLKPIAPHVTSLHAVAIAGNTNSLTATQSAAYAQDCGITASAHDSLVSALKAFNEMDGDRQNKARLLICGSLYLAGEFLRQNATLPK